MSLRSLVFRVLGLKASKATSRETEQFGTGQNPIESAANSESKSTTPTSETVPLGRATPRPRAAALPGQTPALPAEVLFQEFLSLAKGAATNRNAPKLTESAVLKTIAGNSALLAECWTLAWESAGFTIKALSSRSTNHVTYRTLDIYRSVISSLQRRNPEVCEAQLVRFVSVLREEVYCPPSQRYEHYSYWLPVSGGLRLLEKHVGLNGLSDEMRGQLSAIVINEIAYHSVDDERMQARIAQILDPAAVSFFDTSEGWAEAFVGELANLLPPASEDWRLVLSHCASSGATNPSAKWLKGAAVRVEALGQTAFAEAVIRAFPMVDAQPGCQLSDQNSDVLKGMVWCCGLLDDPGSTRALGTLAERMYRKVPGLGAVSKKVGNACVNTLCAMEGMEPISQLARLNLRVKDRMALGLIQQALEKAAARTGMRVEELAEISVPTYSLNEDGGLQTKIGSFCVEAAVDGTGLSDWRWTGETGKTQKSVPAEVKNGHAEEWKALQTAAKEIGKMLPAQRDRIERLMASERSIAYKDWRERYLDHPLLAGFARRLIWHFASGDRSALGIWHAAGLVGVRDESLDWLSDGSLVRLWHPTGADPHLVLAWREWLESHQVTQPFKQAHREVYLLTEAELNTATYSNHFAAHVLKHHQFAALCRQRGWKYQLFESFNASLVVSGWDLKAEFWVEPVDGADAYSEMGVSNYVTTDQVRFYGPDDALLPLAEVPALAFTEVMRDVDLFVGVSSVGNDPQWQDGGPDGRYREYWEAVSFGDLNATAETRRDVLERRLPRLKIASRCAIKGKFLVVKGDRRTYKIHLGSGNILMEPNDQYLCIVPDRSPAKSGDGKLFLPFEGDSVLSLILSKAFLLADDTKITDKTILSQIKR